MTFSDFLIRQNSSSQVSFIGKLALHVGTSAASLCAFFVQTKKEEEIVTVFHVFGFISHFTLFLSRSDVFLTFLHHTHKK